MCGLSGFFSFKEPIFKERKGIADFIAQCVYVGGVRGRDSTGIFTISRKDHRIAVTKAAVDGSMFIDQHSVSNHLKDVTNNIACVVHHRKASKGAIIQKNAHPFREGPITLVHNGGVFAHRQLGTGNTCDVDSQGIAVALGQVSKSAVLEELSGSYVLIWHDSRDNTINIAKNDERPLAIAAVTGENTVLFASEVGMLKWLAERNSISIKEVFYPKSNVLFSWDLNKDKDELKVTKYDRLDYEPKKASYTWPDQQGVYNNRNRNGNTQEVTFPAKKSGTAGGAHQTTPINPNISTKEQIGEKLLELGLKRGERVRFLSTDFDRYRSKSSSAGSLAGFDVGWTFETIAHGVIRKPDDKTIEGCLCDGEICTIQLTKGWPNWCTIILKDVKILEENYQENKTQREIQEDISRTKAERKSFKDENNKKEQLAEKQAEHEDTGKKVKETKLLCPPEKKATTTFGRSGSDKSICSKGCTKLCQVCANCFPDLIGEYEVESVIEQRVREANEERSRNRPSPYCVSAACSVVCGECAAAECSGDYVEPSSIASNLFYNGPNMSLIPAQEWEERTKNGCAYCSCDLNEPDDVYWTWGGDCLCMDCGEMFDEDERQTGVSK